MAEKVQSQERRHSWAEVIGWAAAIIIGIDLLTDN
jgi:hypothetical protein